MGQYFVALGFYGGVFLAFDSKEESDPLDPSDHFNGGYGEYETQCNGEDYLEGHHAGYPSNDIVGKEVDPYYVENVDGEGCRR